MFTCASCGSNHTEGPVCSVCKQHYDFSCSGVTEAGYRKLGDRKNSWRCPKCKNSLTQVPAATSPQPSQLDKIQEQLNNIVFQLAPLASLVADVKSIKSDLNNVKESQMMDHQLIADLSGTVKTLDSRIKKAEKVAQEVPALQAEIARLNQELQDREQWARANNVEIKGVPQKKNENLYEIAQKVGQMCEYPINKVDINYIARIPTRVPNSEKSIVISFHNRYTKEELVAASRRNKQLNLSRLGFDTVGSFYVNDHLTRRNKTLLSKTRTLAKEKNFQYVWVKHCKIMARKTDTSPIFFIKSENDLVKLV